MGIIDLKFRDFKILIGAPEDTPNSFTANEILLGPGHKHDVLISPTFIRTDFLDFLLHLLSSIILLFQL